MSEATVRFRLLGPLEARQGGRVVTIPAGQAPQVLGVLLLHAGQVIGIDTFHDVLWDGDGPASFRKIIQVRVSQLRGLFADTPVRIIGSRQGYRLELPADSLDLHEFRELVAQASDQDPAVAEPLLRRALRLWRGPALTELAGTTRGMRLVAAMSEEYLSTVETYAEVALAAGSHAELPGALAPVLAEHPLRERLRARLMIALSRVGRQSEALAVFDEGRRLLADELGMDPGRELRVAQTLVLHGDPDRLPHEEPGRTAVAVPAQLPADLRGFAGRDDDLDRLDGVLDGHDTAADGTTAVVITALSGTAGVGKTALAVHWAHRIADRFPDGQLYVNLRGFDPAGSAVSAAEAIRGFLDALGVAPQLIPASLDAQAALYRSRLAGRRMLVLLDNARDAEQVRPLLPGSPGCLVVVTSRNQLSSLVAADGAHPIAVDLLTAAEAEELLRRRLGPNRIAAEPGAVAELVTRCARLPIALAVVAARAAARPSFPLRVLAEELRLAQHGLDPLDGGDPVADVRSVFSWSYHALSTGAAHLFRLLGLHPGPDVATPAAASLAGAAIGPVRPLLAELSRVNLITEHLPDRYTQHDLLRSYAIELAQDHDSPADRNAATHRMLDHYLHTAHAADWLLRPQSPSPAPPDREAEVTPETFADVEAALAWFNAEHDVLLACVEHAAHAGFDSHTLYLPLSLKDYLERAYHWHDHAAVQIAALAAAERLADRQSRAWAHRAVGTAYTRLGRYDDAYTHHQHAQSLFDELDDLAGQATNDMCMAYLLEQMVRYEEGLYHSRRALTLYRAAGQRSGQGRALASQGWLLALLGDYEQALVHCQDALPLLRETGDGLAEAAATHTLGYIHQRLGHDSDALTRFQRALTLFRHAGDRYLTADTLVSAGEAHHGLGDLDAARDAWQRALTIMTELDHPDAGRVRAKLLDLDRAGSALSR
jgi:DNA-binding SARP family transcriptional activator/tetratricopeptide (TPR) repeat protein